MPRAALAALAVDDEPVGAGGRRKLVAGHAHVVVPREGLEVRGPLPALVALR